MFKRVDTECDDIEGFSYSNLYNEMEFVEITESTVKIKDSGGEISEIFISDIPNLIKALEAAYKHLTEGSK